MTEERLQKIEALPLFTWEYHATELRDELISAVREANARVKELEELNEQGVEAYNRLCESFAIAENKIKMLAGALYAIENRKESFEWQDDIARYENLLITCYNTIAQAIYNEGGLDELDGQEILDNIELLVGTDSEIIKKWKAELLDRGYYRKL